MRHVLLALLPCLVCLGCVSGQVNHPVAAGPPQTAAAPQSGVVVLQVNGLGCPLCATNVKKGLTRLDGVRDAQVDLGAGKVVLGTDPAHAPTDDQLAATVKQCGFTLVRVEHP